MTGNAPDLNVLHRVLARYVNSGCLSSRDKYASMLSKKQPFRTNAEYVLEIYNAARDSVAPSVRPARVFDIPVYSGSNRFVTTMMEYLNEHLRDDLAGAYVHGSLGTYDETAYSDFDAIVILADSVFQSKSNLVRVATRLHDARQIMTDCDPLQHHGWFTLAQCSLDAYPCSYFPPELFAYAKALLPDKGRQLVIRPVSNADEYKDNFLELVGDVMERLAPSRRPRNVFQLKSLLSEFMLLPACYVQARDGTGIYKKASFASARPDFSAAQWSIMDEVSGIRASWHFALGRTRKWLITRNTVAGRRMTQRFSPAIPGELQKVLTEEFYGRMLALAHAMRSSVTVNRHV